MSNYRKKVAIIGGGVSGISLALNLDTDIEVDIFERGEDTLKKLLMTGNGKANIFTKRLDAEFYNDQQFMKSHIETMKKELPLFFKNMQIAVFSDDYGRYYPLSNSAKALVKNLKDKLDNNVVVHLNTNVNSIIKENGKYIINANKDKLYDQVVITTGSSAGLNRVELDNNNSQLFKQMGLKTTDYKKTISSITIKEDLSLLENERLEGELSLLDNNKNVIIKDEGEVLFKKNALSGIVSFVLSSYLAWETTNEKKDFFLNFNIIKNKEEIIKEYLDNKLENEAILDGLFSLKVNKYLTNRLKGNFRRENVLKLLTNLTFKVNPIQSADNAQAVHGGVELTTVNPLTLESNSLPNLFFGGEVLNIDGICGGFNLSFAFYSGILLSKTINNK